MKAEVTMMCDKDLCVGTEYFLCPGDTSKGLNARHLETIISQTARGCKGISKFFSYILSKWQRQNSNLSNMTP